jgi:hypothetical protein
MNEVQRILHEVSDQDLKTAVTELHHLDTTGVLESGVCRDLAQKLKEGVGLSGSDSLTLVKRQILVIAANKWAGILD